MSEAGMVDLVRDDRDRIIRLETQMQSVLKEMTEVKADLRTILNTLAEISGGKKAVWGLCAAIGSVIGSIATLFGLHVFGR